jgi:hypothetical protein
MGGDYEMLTEVVEPVAHRLAGAGADLDERWRAGRGEIEAGEAAIGNDPMAAAFRALYDNDSRLVRQIADETPGAMRGDGELGGECVTIYSDAEANATAGLRDVIAEGA